MSSEPHSAIAAWSGFIYQGHIALYHSICCLIESQNFTLQLDSVEDFSIFQNGFAKSTHQVKALASDKREQYTDALEKASSTNFGCNSLTQRYIHVSSKLDDTSDFTGVSGNLVKFYKYDKKLGEEAFCYLHDVEKEVKRKIHEYLNVKKLVSSDFLLDFKFDLLHSKIASHVVLMHAYNQDGLGNINEIAYKQTITSAELEQLLNEVVEHPQDLIYSTVKAKTRFFEYFYDYLDSSSLSDIEAPCRARLVRVLNSIKSLDEQAFVKFWKSLCFGSKTLELENERVYDYVDIIQEIYKEPLLANYPPYYRCSKNESYLPTSITIKNTRRETKFAEDLISHLKEDANMIDILVEYEWLIASCADQFSPLERFCQQKK